MLSVNKLKTYLDLVKFEHTIFALPFAYAGMLIAARGWPGFHIFFWVTMAMAGARTAAMGLNRLIDATIDAKNPRTAQRHIPKGQVKIREAIILSIFSIALLIFSAYQLGSLPLILLPIAVFFLIFYSYTKRFTWLCHLWLGITDGAAAAGGWIAVTGRFDLGAWLLWLVVIFWIMGLDIIYATQDYEFDQKNGLYSIPVRFGIEKSLVIAKYCHLITWLLLIAVGLACQMGLIYFIGVAIMGLILLYEHSIVAEDDLSKVNAAFFTANSWLALTMLVSVVLGLSI